MRKLLSHISILRENFPLLMGLCLCFYFTYHTVHGNRSIMRLYGLERQIETTTLKEQRLVAEKVALQKKNSMMRPGSEDKYLLEERVRVVLGYRSPDDYTVLNH